MIGSCFVDASFVIALGLKRDQHHHEAATLWRQLVGRGVGYATTDYVLCEVVAFLQRRDRHDLAVKFGGLLLAGREISLVCATEERLGVAWRRLIRDRDKSFSLADCVSFQVMGDLGIHDALTFDHHFAQAGFRMVPGP